MATSTKTVRVELTGDPSSLERSLTVVSEKSAQTASNMEGHAHRIGGAFSSLDNLLGGFGIPFTGALSEIGDKLDGLGTKGESTFKKISNAGGIALAAVGVAAVGIGIESVHLADQFEKSHANLETAVKNSGGSMEKLNPILDAQESKFAKLGYNATQYEGALAAGTVATGNSQKALGLVSHAADLAAFSHTSLEKATIALAKAQEGNLRPLKQLGIDLPIHAANAAQVKDATNKLADAQDKLDRAFQKVGTTTGKDQVKAYAAFLKAQQDVTKAQADLNEKTSAGGEILDGVYKKIDGAGAKSAETFQGKVKALEAELENMGIKIGLFLIPIIEDLVSAITDVVGWFEKHKEVAIALAGVITTVLGAAIAVFVYDKIAAFVGGIQRMLTGLGLLKVQAEETAAAVEASGATIAESGAAAGAGVGAAEVGAGAGEAGAALGGVAAGEAEVGAGAATAGTSLLGILAPLGLVAGAAYGLYTAFHESAAQITVHTEKLDEMSSGAMTRAIAKLQEFGGQWNNNHAAADAFNQILDKSPQYAQKFIDAAHNAGLNTDDFSRKLREHVIATEEAKNAQERFSLQLQIADAKARGDTDAVDRLTYQMLLVPSDKQVQLSVNGTAEALNNIYAVHSAVDALPLFREIGIRVVGDTGNSNFSLNPNASDRNIKYNIVPVT